MKWTVLVLGLWLASAQGFAAPICCWDMPSTKASCGHCGDQAGSKPAPRPDCCTSLESQKDIDTLVTKHEIPTTPVEIDPRVRVCSRVPEKRILTARNRVHRNERII